jgi:hypothetical protein
MFLYIVYLVSFILLRPRHFLLRRWTHTFTYTVVVHSRIDGASLDTGTDDAEDDSIAHYVEDYD